MTGMRSLIESASTSADTQGPVGSASIAGGIDLVRETSTTPAAWAQSPASTRSHGPSAAIAGWILFMVSIQKCHGILRNSQSDTRRQQERGTPVFESGEYSFARFQVEHFSTTQLV